jgi:hypothetical protein
MSTRLEPCYKPGDILEHTEFPIVILIKEIIDEANVGYGHIDETECFYKFEILSNGLIKIKDNDRICILDCYQVDKFYVLGNGSYRLKKVIDKLQSIEGLNE